MLTISYNTIKEFLRNKILYVILAAWIGLVFFTLILSSLALSETSKVVLDFAFSTIEIFGLITTLFLGSSLIYNEISKNTILLLLSKNPSRTTFILGKFFGFSAILLLLYFILWIAFLWVIWMHWLAFDPVYFIVLLFSYLKILIVLSLLLLFSTFMSPFISLLISLAVYLLAHTIVFVKFYIQYLWKASFGIGDYLISFFYFVIPNFHDLSLKEFLLSPQLGMYSSFHVLITIGSSFLYLFIILTLASRIFNKREF